MKAKPVTTVDAYIKNFPAPTQKLLKQLRAIIKKAAPKATEVISYQMPAYKLDGMLVYFAGYEKHIGLYPMPAGIEEFKPELTKYKTSKATVQFPLNKPLPVKLISDMVKFRMEQNRQAAEIKALKNKKKK